MPAQEYPPPFYPVCKQDLSNGYQDMLHAASSHEPTMTIPSPLPLTMRAVVLKSQFNVVVEDRPTPQITKGHEMIIKVVMSGLCGSDLHWYRGHAKSDYNFITGHEAVGQVVQIGSSVQKFREGDTVIVPFSSSCGECFYCEKGYTARCQSARAYGTPACEGAQAEYFKIDMADSCVFKAPYDLPRELLVLMTDIIPTGYSVAQNARTLLDTDGPRGKRGEVCVVIGCGPVGLCAISSALTMFETVLATDIALQRLEAAQRHGAIALPLDQLRKKVAMLTKGRGADAILEVVGHNSALVTATELARPFGVISSCGVHNLPVSLPGTALYGKNLRIQFGRCSVPRYFEGAMKVLQANRELFGSFVENKITLEQAPEFYKLFEQGIVAKTVFVVD